MEKENKILVLLGMHRSGTSLLSNWLHKSGLHFGDRLLGKGIANLDGHFEDLDFLDLHRQLLKENNLEDYLVWDAEDIVTSEYFNARAKSLITLKNGLHEQWGWKEPRTCLFLPLWKNVSRDFFYLISFRHPAAVVDSIIRREAKKVDRIASRSLYRKVWAVGERHKLKKNLEQRKINVAKTWLYYNQCILRHTQSEKRHFINIDNIDGIDQKVPEQLNAWGFNMNWKPFATVYKKNRIKSFEGEQFTIDNALNKECLEVYELLNKYVS